MSREEAYNIRARVAYYLHSIEEFGFDEVRHIFNLHSRWRAQQLVLRGERLFHMERRYLWEKDEGVSFAGQGSATGIQRA